MRPAGHHSATGAGRKPAQERIRAASGSEWDVVIVGSLTEPDMESDRVGRNLAEFLDSGPVESADLIGDFDRARLHYVAFTRAKEQPWPTVYWEAQAR